MIIMTAQSAQQ